MPRPGPRLHLLDIHPNDSRLSVPVNPQPVDGYVAVPPGATTLPAGTPVFHTIGGVSIYAELYKPDRSWVAGVHFRAGDLNPTLISPYPYCTDRPLTLDVVVPA